LWSSDLNAVAVPPCLPLGVAAESVNVQVLGDANGASKQGRDEVGATDILTGHNEYEDGL
jgi:hypothetical protein